MSQPTISKSLDALERSIGFTLFVREGRRLTPTPEALALYSEVSRAWRGLDNLPVIARSLRQPTQGRLVVGANPTLVSGFVPRLIALFLAEHPGVTIQLDSDTGRNLIQRGLAGLIDIGFATRNVRQDFSRAATIPSIPVASGQMVCVLPVTHPLANRRFVGASDIAPFPFIALTTAPEAREMIDSVFVDAGVSPTIVAEASTAPAACQLTATGIGLTLVGALTAHTISAVDRSTVAIRPFRPEVRFAVEYAISRHAEKSQLAEAFAATARQHGPAVLRALTGEAHTDPPDQGPPRKTRPQTRPTKRTPL